MTQTTENQRTETPTLEEVLTTWLPTGKAAQVAGIGERYMLTLITTGKLRSVTTPIGRLIEPTQLAAYAEEHKQRYRMPEYVEANKEGRTIGPGDPPTAIPKEEPA